MFQFLFRFRNGRPRQLPARIGIWLLIAAGSALASASSPPPPTTHTIVLHASLIDITADRIVATGSPVLSSDQGSIAANQFTVSLDSKGRAQQASAAGGVRFTLTTVMGPYRSATGTCNQAVLYPQEKRAVLSGGLSGTLQGPGAAPISLHGATQADLFGAAGGTAGHFLLHGPSVVTTQTRI